MNNFTDEELVIIHAALLRYQYSIGKSRNWILKTLGSDSEDSDEKQYLIFVAAKAIEKIKTYLFNRI